MTLSVQQTKTQLEAAHVAGFIYQQDNLLVLQEPLTLEQKDQNVFIQHDETADQLGIQFGIKVLDERIELLIGITHSNQDKSYEIGAGNLRGEQRAFNLLYAFYNYPKGFYLVRLPLMSDAESLQDALDSQLFQLEQMAFLNSAVQTNALGEQSYWMKSFVVQQSLDMQQRLRAALNG